MLNSELILSKSLAKQVSNIVNQKQEPQQFTVVAKLFSTTGEIPYEFEIEKLINIRIVQRFTIDYSDYIEMSFEMSPTEYMELFKNYQNLWCDLKFTNIEPQTLEKKDMFLNMRTRFILKDKVDLEQMYPKNVLYPSKEHGTMESHMSAAITVNCQLIEPEVYTMRKVRLNNILRHVDTTQVLRYISNKLGMDKTYIVKANNEKIYDNYIIPPMLDITNVFDYMQNGSGKGVYNKGINFYFTRGIFYIYPQYETEVETKKVVNLYHVTTNLHQGMKTYHLIDKDNIHILINQDVEYKDYTAEGMENAATAILMGKGERMVDKWHNRVDNRKFEVYDDNVDFISTTNTKGMMDDTFNLKYVLSKDNPYTVREEILKEQIVITSSAWPNAIPYTFKPGWKVVYHTDASVGYKVQNGIATNVIYMIDRIGRPDDKTKWIFSCSCNFTVYLTP